MVLKIREGIPADEAALLHICLVTGDAGKSAEPLVKTKELPGLIFAAPYVHLASAYCFVLVDDADSATNDSTDTVVGYIVGSTNCRAYERDAAENWYPAIRAKYSYPLDDAQEYSDVERLFLPQEVLDIYQAYLHINILEPYRGKGWGTRLIRAAAEAVKKDGGKGLWVRLNPKNEESLKFYTAIGFEKITTVKGEFYGFDGEFYGIDVEKYLNSDRGK
ncbi:hypothetical protein M408DRAFT_316707 [Serendipita vermifera MAFF 305830]|uniref:N-acetyltransferase domain-containing protein n=1 Tax=Serendipita vermifera MAFF 305830 TaxID=933852 RepID=A0A0C3AK57_SERVB|nr:hypothetical protein M408DRAFT_316707 [Serendipita vermifera MAFF 305830]